MSDFIPATAPMEAVFESKDGENESTRTVIAWDDDGIPMVVGKKGLLVRATMYTDFTEVREAEKVDVVSGGGWLIEYTDAATGKKWSEPVVAWRIVDGHFGGPLWTDCEGSLSWTEYVKSGEIRVWHPDAVGDVPA